MTSAPEDAADQTLRMAMAMRAALPEIDELLAPRDGDERVVRLARSAPRELFCSGSRKSRETLVARALGIGQDDDAKTAGELTWDGRLKGDRRRELTPPIRRGEGRSAHLFRFRLARLVQLLHLVQLGAERAPQRGDDTDPRRFDSGPAALRQSLWHANASSAAFYAADPATALPSHAEAARLLGVASCDRIRHAVKQIGRSGLPLEFAAIAAEARVSPNTLLRDLEGRTLVLEARARRAGGGQPPADATVRGTSVRAPVQSGEHGRAPRRAADPQIGPGTPERDPKIQPQAKDPT